MEFTSGDKTEENISLWIDDETNAVLFISYFVPTSVNCYDDLSSTIENLKNAYIPDIPDFNWSEQHMEYTYDETHCSDVYNLYEDANQKITLSFLVVPYGLSVYVGYHY